MIADVQFAVPLYEHKEVQPAPPLTQIWIGLYAQVAQADGSGLRNVQIDLRQAAALAAPAGVGRVSWQDSDVSAALAALALPDPAPLSMLAVELLPEPIALYAQPLGANLGEVRIMRTSLLVSMAPHPC